MSITDNQTLVAQWVTNSYTVTFVFDNGSVIIITYKYDEEIIYPDAPAKEGHSFSGWCARREGRVECGIERVLDEDLEFTEQWAINNYTLTFDFGNGTVVNKTFNYNETIIYPTNLTREGFTFKGWKPKQERMPANDTTVVAQWIEVVAEVESEYVEIVFDRKSMTEDEVKEIIKNITQDENIYIERIETDKDTGETTVIIRFTDTENAKDFVRSVSEGKASSTIKRVRTVSPEQNSFALKINAMTMTALLILFVCVTLS